MPPATPELHDLVFWGTADPAYLPPPAARAGVFGTPNVSFIAPQPTTAFFGDADLTVASWVMPTDTGAFARQSPYCQWNINGNERKFYFANDVDSDQIEFGVFKAPAAAVLTTQGAMANGVWYRLVGCHDEGNQMIRLYVNGQLVDSRSHTAGIETGDGLSPQRPWLGDFSRGDTNYDVNQFWRGFIGPTSYYARVWSPQEVSWDYNAGSARGYGEVGQAGTDGAALLNGLVAHWEMTEEDTGLGPYVVRRDASAGQHHLHELGTHPTSAPGILANPEPIGESQRIERWVDRSPLQNDLTQSDHARRPFWDSRTDVVSIEAGTSLARTGLAGLDGDELSVYVVSIVKDAAPGDPWLRLDGGAGPGLTLYRDGDRVVANASIGGRTRELSFQLSYPAERLLEVHYDGRRFSLWENGSLKASTRAAGGVGQQLTALQLGPSQGLSELLLYNGAHR